MKEIEFAVDLVSTSVMWFSDESGGEVHFELNLEIIVNEDVWEWETKDREKWDIGADGFFFFCEVYGSDFLLGSLLGS